MCYTLGVENRKMKIAVYKDNLSTGRGADLLICALADGLAQRGHSIFLISNPSKQQPTFALPSTVDYRQLEKNAIIPFVLSAHVDVIIAAGSNEILDLTNQGQLPPPLPTLTMMLVAPHGFFKWRHPLRNRRIKRAFSLSQGIQILCHAYEAKVRRMAPKAQITVIREWPTQSTLDATPKQERKPVIVYPAAFNKNKNQLLLIRAFAQVATQFPEWELHLYGKAGNSYGRKCQRIAQKSGLENRIRFLGFTNDLPRVLNEASILAFPSLLEGFPLTVIDGMLSRLPTLLVRELPAAQEMIENNRTGIISSNRVKAYADSLRTLLTDPGLRDKLGDAARTFVISHLSKSAVLDVYEKCLTNLISSSSSGDKHQNEIELFDLRNATKRMQKKILKWRNSHNVACMFQLKHIDKKTHKEWIKNLYNPNQDTIAFLIKVNFSSKPEYIGLTYLRNIDKSCKKADFGIYIYDTKYRGRNIGSIVIKKLINYAINELNLRTINLQVLAKNDIAIKLYEKNGFIFVKQNNNVKEYKYEIVDN